MKVSTLRRHFREGVKNIGRNGWMSFASVSAVSVTLLILGVFLLLALNVNHIARNVEKQVEIRVFLDVTTDEKGIAEVEKKIALIPEVATSRFVSKEQGLKELKESFGEKAYLLDGLEKENPLPDSFVVKAKRPQDTEKVAKEIEKFAHVNSVRYGKGYIERLFTVTETIRNLGLALIIGLAFTAMFLIANTIKLTIVARRKEIEIMKLVGATNGFIRWPFFVEGLLMGLLGSLLPIALLMGGYAYLLNQVPPTFFFIELLPYEPFVYQISLLLAAIGAFIGIWGSLFSVHRFLRV
ncbi:permease-like cell division protein FtsX [Bacillaceae bacterium]